jgi:hypothetical protein
MRLLTSTLSWLALVALPLQAQNSTAKAGGSFTVMATRMWEHDDGGTIQQLLVRSGPITSGQGNFEWSAGIVESGGVGGLAGEAGGALAFGPRGATVLLRGGLCTLLTQGIPAGAYGGVSLLLGDFRNLSLRIDLARHSYRWERQTRSLWVAGVGFSWRPGPRMRTDRGR